MPLGCCNKLAREAEADLLIFGNADARPEPDMVRLHVEAMRRLPAGSMVLGARASGKAARGRRCLMRCWRNRRWSFFTGG